MVVITRRSFLKLSGTAAAAAGVGTLGFDLSQAYAKTAELKIKESKAVPTICPYCGVGCGILIHVDKEGKVIHVEGDAEHPINRGSLCSKGASLGQLHNNDRRLKKPLYRAPGSDKWEEKDWDWTLTEIVKRVKETRDKSFIHKEGDLIVNRTEAIASLGGAALDNEECYLMSKLNRGLGLVYFEHQARI